MGAAASNACRHRRASPGPSSPAAPPPPPPPSSSIHSPACRIMYTLITSFTNNLRSYVSTAQPAVKSPSPPGENERLLLPSPEGRAHGHSRPPQRLRRKTDERAAPARRLPPMWCEDCAGLEPPLLQPRQTTTYTLVVMDWWSWSSSTRSIKAWNTLKGSRAGFIRPLSCSRLVFISSSSPPPPPPSSSSILTLSTTDAAGAAPAGGVLCVILLLIL